MYDYQASPDAGAGLGMFTLFIWLALYVFVSWGLMSMAKNLGHGKYAWWAWIPVLNMVLMCKMAGKPEWWFVLMFIPIVNIIVAIVLWAKIVQGLGQSLLWLVLMFVPVINLFAYAKLALSKPPRQYTPPPAQPQQQPQQVG